MLSAGQFAGLMAPLVSARRVAVAVSGGADSMCLAWLAKGWGDPVALIVDHGLRPESAWQAAETASRLARFGVPSRIMALGLQPGPGLAARARTARYAALTHSCQALGLTDLLLGHHARDQAETVLIRQQAASGQRGLAAMPAVRELDSVRLLRPLLGTAPGLLRKTLQAAGVAWFEDPSNVDQAAQRSRVRAALADDGGDGAAVRRLCGQAARAGIGRAQADRRIADTLGARATLFPEGYALLTPGPIAADCLGALICMLGGRVHVPGSRALAWLATDPRAGTLGGVRLLPAGRLGDFTLLVREAAAMAPAMPARHGGMWDGRFVLSAPGLTLDGVTLAGVGGAAAMLRGVSALPSAILQTLPALWQDGALCAVPHLGYRRSGSAFTGWTNAGVRLTLRPACPAAGGVWLGDAQAAQAHHVGLQDKRDGNTVARPGQAMPAAGDEFDEREPAGLPLTGTQ